MLASIVTLGLIGLLAACALGFAAKKFHVEIDPREQALLDILPGANCGACGYPGCAGYAKGVVASGSIADICPPGGQTVMQKVAKIMDLAPVTANPQISVVICQGDNKKAVQKYNYLGLTDCRAAQKLADGPKTCPAGCLGLGTCAMICPFGAIEMTPDSLAVIDRKKCTGCGKCVKACPRFVIKLTPLDATTHVLCNSHDKGALVRKYCQVGCIACQICKKTAPGAYEIENMLASVVYDQHREADQAVDKCPTHCIRNFASGYPDGSRFAAPTVPIKKTKAA
ncbi:MAG: RnfABCDGE type electron transport complex subunit B [Desulfuromonadales bacterium]|nr:RnfABCDGE type electron transport complex subunit B [Desulfuromonadales bacterium]